MNGKEQDKNTLVFSNIAIHYNNFSLFDPGAPQRILDFIIEVGYLDTVLRLTSRLTFSLNMSTHDLSRLYRDIWYACNIHADLGFDSENKSGKATNLLGDENAQIQLTLDQSVSFLSSNRWYLVVCLIILFYTPTEHERFIKNNHATVYA